MKVGQASAEALALLGTHLADDQKQEIRDWIEGSGGDTGLKNRGWHVRLAAIQAFKGLEVYHPERQQPLPLDGLLGISGNTGLRDERGELQGTAVTILASLSHHLSQDQKQTFLDWLLGTGGNTGLKSTNPKFDRVAAVSGLEALVAHLSDEQKQAGLDGLFGNHGSTGLHDAHDSIRAAATEALRTLAPYLSADQKQAFQDWLLGTGGWTGLRDLYMPGGIGRDLHSEAAKTYIALNDSAIHDRAVELAKLLSRDLDVRGVFEEVVRHLIPWESHWRISGKALSRNSQTPPQSVDESLDQIFPNEVPRSLRKAMLQGSIPASPKLLQKLADRPEIFTLLLECLVHPALSIRQRAWIAVFDRTPRFTESELEKISAVLLGTDSGLRDTDTKVRRLSAWAFTRFFNGWDKNVVRESIEWALERVTRLASTIDDNELAGAAELLAESWTSLDSDQKNDIGAWVHGTSSGLNSPQRGDKAVASLLLAASYRHPANEDEKRVAVAWLMGIHGIRSKNSSEQRAACLALPHLYKELAIRERDRVHQWLLDRKLGLKGFSDNRVPMLRFIESFYFELPASFLEPFHDWLFGEFSGLRASDMHVMVAALGMATNLFERLPPSIQQRAENVLFTPGQFPSFRYFNPDLAVVRLLAKLFPDLANGRRHAVVQWLFQPGSGLDSRARDGSRRDYDVSIATELLGRIYPHLDTTEQQHAMSWLMGKDTGLRDPDEDVRAKAVEAAFEIFDEETTTKISRLVDQLNRDLDAPTRGDQASGFSLSNVLRTHWRIGGNGSDISQKAYVPESLEDTLALLLPEHFPKGPLQPGEPLMRRLVGLLGKWPSLDPLLELALKHNNEDIRVSAARACENIRQVSETILNNLLGSHGNTGLKDSSSKVNTAASLALLRLIRFSDANQIGLTLDWILGSDTGLRDSDSEVRERAARLLGQLAHRLNPGQIQSALDGILGNHGDNGLKDSSWDVRETAIEALLSLAIRADPPDIRSALEWILGTHGDTGLKDRAWQVKRTAGNALGTARRSLKPGRGPVCLRCDLRHPRRYRLER